MSACEQFPRSEERLCESCTDSAMRLSERDWLFTLYLTGYSKL